MEGKRIKILLTKYLFQKTDSTEFIELKNLIDNTSDDECKEILNVLWENNQYKKDFPSRERMYDIFNNINNIIDEDTQQVQIQKKRKVNLFFIRIAATLIIGVLTFYSIYLHHENSSLRLDESKFTTFMAPIGGKAKMILPDGSSVELNSDSKLSYLSDYGSKEREISLSGEAFFEVAHDKQKPFIVNTSNLRIRVLGTVFNVSAYSDSEKEELSLLSGSVKVSCISDSSISTVLKPDQMVTFNKETNEMSVTDVEATNSNRWIDGELIFNSEKLKYVFRKIERKYNVNINFVGPPELLDDRFTGNISSQNVDDLMQILRLHYKFKYVIDGKMITIRCN